MSTVARLSRSSSHASTMCASLTNLGHRHSRFGGLSTPHPPKTPLISNLTRRRSTGTTTAVTAAPTTTSTVALRPTSCTSSAGAFLRVRSRAAVTAVVKWFRRVMVPWRQWQRDGGDGASRRWPPSPLRRRRLRWWSARDARRKRSRARPRRARAPPAAHSAPRRNTAGGARHVYAAATPPPPLHVRDTCDTNVRVEGGGDGAATQPPTAGRGRSDVRRPPPSSSLSSSSIRSHGCAHRACAPAAASEASLV